MFFPQEIIDNIVFSLVIFVYQPENRAGNETDRLWLGGRLFKTNTRTDTLGIGHRMAFDLKAVCDLRLVSFAWHASATKLLQKYNSWRLDLDSERLLANARRLCTKDVGKGRLPPTCNMIRRLKIPPIMTSMSPKKMQYEEIEGRPSEEELSKWPKDSVQAYRLFVLACVSDVNGEEAHERSTAMAASYSELQQVFESLVQIESFDIAFPGASIMWDYESAESHILDIVNALADKIEHGLQTDAFVNLQELRVSLPGPYYIRRYLGGMGDVARNNLKHLFIGITDSTGAAGCHEFIQHSRKRRRDLDGIVYDSRRTVPRIPPSRLQLYKPNRRHEDCLWEFISSCPNLKSLGIKATHYLDLRKLKWESSAHLNGLSELYLSRVYVDRSSIIRLLQPSQHNRAMPQLQHFTLDDVKMHQNAGSWSGVIRFLLDCCVHLNYFSLSQLSYFCDHPRARGRDKGHRYYDEIIATNSREDIDSVRELVDRFLEGEGGILNCPEVYFIMARSLGYDSLDCEWGSQ